LKTAPAPEKLLLEVRDLAVEFATDEGIVHAANGISYDLQSGGIERVSVDSTGTEANGSSYIPSLSADGRYAAFTSSATNLVSGDANGENDVFVAPNG